MLTLPNKKWFQPIEVAEYFSVHRQTAYRWIADGTVDAIKVKGVLRISRDTILKLEAAQDDSDI